MLYLAITPAGLNEALRSATTADTVWCGSDAISEAEYSALKHSNLSRFIYKLGDRHRLNDAVSTIEEHHPGQIIWVEAKHTTSELRETGSSAPESIP